MLSLIERFSLKIILASLIYLASGSLQLFMDGGARQQGFENISKYNGPLKLILPAWVLACTLIVIWMLLIRKRYKTIPLKASIIIIFGTSLISTIWADSTYAAIRTLYLIFLCYLFTSIYSYYFSKIQTLKTLGTIFYIIGFASLLTATLFPSYGIYLDQEKIMWQGIFPHKNALGNFSALSYCIFLGLTLAQRNKSPLIGCVLSAILVFMSKSSTSISAVLACSCIYISFSTPFIKNILIRSRKLFIIALFAISCSLVSIALTGDKLNIFDKDTSFSQRDIIWARVLIKSIESPIFGFGLDQFQTIFINKGTDLSYVTGTAVSHAHNGFIEAFFYLGITGLIAAGTLLFSLACGGRRNNDLKINLIFLTTFIVINSFEAQFLSFNPYLVVLLILIQPNRDMDSTRLISSQSTNLNNEYTKKIMK